MPPIPLDFTDITPTRKLRTRLNLGQPPTYEFKQSVSLKVQDVNILQNEANGNGNDVKKSVKRLSELSDLTPTAKRRRFQHFNFTPELNAKSEMVPLSPLSNIIQAVDKLSTESDLVADGSRVNILPTIPGKHSDLSTISPETMSDVLDGVYDNCADKVTIIDCRYPYEYEGGHIKGAINLYTKDAVQRFLSETATSPATNHVLIFHCEFSSERGPKMYRFLRSLDREMNKDNYPRLNFPEIYLLEGGYKAFFYTYKEKCFPQTYKQMLHSEHKDDLRHFRVKSKSWSAGDKPRRASLTGIGMRLKF
ncbi:M-phase inducer phosphatase 1-like [Mercenaria mercenaria]|uniref:M-phase inducer phosphatase 1-like n=1 Tax=Mercenaria mercenaria TaxID=6596 RepID=UPI00234F5122|nr:M-phase inducer phosphatase 1-like [Mercenaria mercenaria]